MEKINFQDLPSTSTPIDSDNLNLLQQNVEDDLGILQNLNTTEKTNLVGAINELIVEKGSNANGFYEKYSDGRLKCYGSITSNITTSANPNVYYTSSEDGFPLITYPASFISKPVTNLTVEGVNWASLYSNSSTQCQVVVYSVAKRENLPTIINYLATGRWK